MSKSKRNIIKLIPEERIVNKIHIIRDQKVMLDFDLANLYDVETKALNQAVKRNSDRFPTDFMFRLSIKEWTFMRSQIVTASAQDIEPQNNKSMRSQNVQLNKIYEAIENLLDDKTEKDLKANAWKRRQRIGFKK